MISLKGVCVEFRRFTLGDISLTIPGGDYFMLVGPTGSGKTLLLETIAGLHRVKQGEISLDGRDLTFLEPEKRNIGMVYQDCALFPHLSVRDNIIFGLKVRRFPKPDWQKAMGEVASLVKINHLLDRKPINLSGGEKQKVALARALAIKPPLLLLDEPLSALDPDTRENLRQELKQIQEELNITVIHVTHDFEEALTLGKHLAVIGEGQIKQSGTPDEIFRKPNSEFVARFTLSRNIFSGEIRSPKGELGVFRSGNLELKTTATKMGKVQACIRPDEIKLSFGDSGIAAPNQLSGTVTRIEKRGALSQVIIAVPSEITCQVPSLWLAEMGLTTEQNVNITISPDAVHVF
jgi:ABC-type Fe3+/spermidine/putrescine transport system ATPase subunit